MARTRRVETAEILDAAERVVVRLGAVGLSLDAVAKEAGISKTRVVYDFKTKSALLEAIVDRQLDEERVLRQELVAQNATAAHPELFARIQGAERVPDELDKAVAMAITVSMASEEGIRAKMQAWIQEDLAAMDAGERPRAAHMAHLALIGFCCHEWFGLMEWTDEERRRTLADVRRIYESFPERSGTKD